jgi:hypothetical protein
VLKGSRQQILGSFLKSQHSTNVLENEDGNLLLQVNNIQVGFFSYGYPLLDPTLELVGCKLASILDIGLMKLDAVISRGSRKDFYDLYWIAKQISLPDLLQSGERKYPMMRDFPLMVVEHLVAFDNADRDHQPDLLKEIQWEEVKAYFIRQAMQLGSSWFFLTKNEEIRRDHGIRQHQPNLAS